MSLQFKDCIPGMHVQIRWNDFNDEDSYQTGTVKTKTASKLYIEWSDGSGTEMKQDSRAFVEDRLTLIN